MEDAKQVVENMLPQRNLDKITDGETSLVQSRNDPNKQHNSDSDDSYVGEQLDMSPVQKAPSSDFTSHFVIRRTSEKSLGEVEPEKRDVQEVSTTAAALSELEFEAKCTIACGPSPIISPEPRNACGFPKKDIRDVTSSDRPKTPLVVICEGAAGALASLRKENSSHHDYPLLNRPSTREKRGVHVHPFMKSLSSTPGRESGNIVMCAPDSPMDGSYQAVSRFCHRKSLHIPSDANCLAEAPLLQVQSNPYEAMLSVCCQHSPIPLSEIMDGLKDLEKIGEGVYGEVYSGTFKYFSQASWVYKVVAIEGKAIINGERQKTFVEILPEIIVSQELSKLREGLNDCVTDGYVKMRNARLAKGIYPQVLVKCWENFHEKYESDNDTPEFPPEQLYMVLEFEFAGQDIESFNFEDARQTLSIVLQVAHALAVGESALEFEHRDLHWGNILVEAWQPLQTQYLLNGKTLLVPALGVKAVVIDFTISRLLDPTGNPIFLDLQEDEEQFLGTGDHQFDIYRMMRDHNRNNWKRFSPKSNVYWLHYLADKLFIKGKYSSPNGPYHKKAIRKLRDFSQVIFEYESSVNFVSSPICESYKEFLLSSVTRTRSESGR